MNPAIQQLEDLKNLKVKDLDPLFKNDSAQIYGL